MSTSNFLLWCGGTACLAVLWAQTPPSAYTVTEVNSMFGPAVDMTIYRNGMKAVVDRGGHSRTLYDLQKYTTQSWDPGNPSACSSGDFSGDWGNPFAASADLVKGNVKEAGAETMNGVALKVVEAVYPEGKIKAWIDGKSGLVMKAQMLPTSGEAATMLEVKKLTLGAPPASIFALPPACAASASVPAEEDRMAALTGGHAADFTSAITPPALKNSCPVFVRIVRAGSMQPVVNGFQLALDTTYDVDHPPSYQTGIGENGKATFSGGGLHEVTGQLRNGVLRIDSPPAYFHLEAHFGKGGDADALIYRQCFGPQGVLLFVVKNPDQLSDGGEWLWAKSGKFATVEGPH